MTCSNPSGTTPGILVAWDPTDTGARPLAANIAFWASPNIRLALQADVAALSNPANWDQPPYAGWNGQVDVGSAYTLLVRLRNTDTSQPRTSLNLQGWVSDYTMGGVGPGSEIAGFTGFTGLNNGPLPAGNPANPNDYASMLVLASEEQWTPTPAQAAINPSDPGHVCVAVNVYAQPTSGGTSGPADGGPLISNFLDPTCDRRYGQRNVQIVTVGQHQRVQIPIMVLVPVTHRSPLQAAVSVRPVELNEGGGGILRNVPELAHAANMQAITALRRPEGDSLEHIQIGQPGPTRINNINNLRLSSRARRAPGRPVDRGRGEPSAWRRIRARPHHHRHYDRPGVRRGAYLRPGHRLTRCRLTRGYVFTLVP